MMNFNKCEQFASDLYCWSVRYNVSFIGSLRLSKWCRLRYNAAVLDCNRPSDGKRLKKIENELESLALQLGFLVEYNGLYPSLVRNNLTKENVDTIPCVD